MFDKYTLWGYTVCVMKKSNIKKSCVLSIYKTSDNKKFLTRLKRIEGQVRGLQRMIEDKKYCIDIITQTSAVRNALRAFEDAILENHLKTCATDQMQSGNKSEEERAIQEILRVYKLKR